MDTTEDNTAVNMMLHRAHVLLSTYAHKFSVNEERQMFGSERVIVETLTEIRSHLFPNAMPGTPVKGYVELSQRILHKHTLDLREQDVLLRAEKAEKLHHAILGEVVSQETTWLSHPYALAE